MTEENHGCARHACIDTSLRCTFQNSRAKITMSEDEDEEEILEKITQQVEDVKSRISQDRQRRKEIKDELRELNKTVKTLAKELPKLTLEISGCDTTREELTKLIPQLREQCHVSDEEAEKRGELQSKIDQCKADMTSCVALADKLEKQVSKLQQDILDAGGPRLKKQKETCEKIMQSLNVAEKSLNSSKVEIVSSEKAVVKSQKSLESLTKQLDECESVLTEKTEELKSLETEALAVVQAYDEVKEIEEKKRKALESATKEAEVLKKSQSELQFVEIDLVGKLDALKKQISESSKKLAHWKNENAHIQAAEEEYELDDDDEEEDEDSEATRPPETNDTENPSSEEDIEMDDAEASTDHKESAKPQESVSSSFALSYSALEKYDIDDLKETIATLQNERNMLAKNANMGAIGEYRKKEADYLARVAELDQVTEERNHARKEHEELRRQRLEMFMEGFGVITLKLKEMYQMITLGGDAELELVDSLDPFSEGIVFSVRPPKKSWKNISNLSGGEKTLSSLSLVFALHHFRPTPLYVMDEIDAALDFKNVSIVANYIKERTRNAQFIIISLRNNMFELADRLCGIYKVRNMTNSVTINPKAFGGGAAAPLTDASNAAAGNKTSPSVSGKGASHILSQDAGMAVA
jgi:structural maintenance of chromosome 4